MTQSLLICGGRNFGMRVQQTIRHPQFFVDPALVAYMFEKLDEIQDQEHFTEVIVGCASGADFIGAVWASSRGLRVREFPADWNMNGVYAGPMRNSKMVKESPSLVVAFAPGEGTKDTLRKANQAEIPTLIFNP